MSSNTCPALDEVSDVLKRPEEKAHNICADVCRNIRDICTICSLITGVETPLYFHSPASDVFAP